VQTFEQRLGTLSEFCEQDINFYIFRGYSVQPRLIKEALKNKGALLCVLDRTEVIHLL